MKNKFINVISICLVTFLLAGCGDGIDIALVTDTGTVTDKSFNQGAYEGIIRYTEENEKISKVYEPKDATTECYLANIKQAVSDGADVIVCPGVLFEEAVYTAQKKYPYVEFILLDGEPHNNAYTDYDIKENTMPMTFAEEQAGFLAGYSAVRDGNTELGFMGGSDLDYVIRYGYGFVQGADYAAIERGVEVNVRYCYSDTFLESETVKSKAIQWYDEGCQVIFACGGLMGKSVMAAAEESNGKVIGVDVDQSIMSSTVITSAKKMLSNAVYTGLSNYYDETFLGGTAYIMDATNYGVGLELENSRFESFSETEYDMIFGQLLSGRITPYASTEYGNCSDLEFVNIVVDYQEL